MSQKMMYICDRCGTMYETDDLAEECSNKHLTKDSIKTCKYRAKAKYPHKVEITFSDGTSRWYKD